MANLKQGIKATKPKNIFIKPLEIDFKELFKALSKGIGHTIIGKWEGQFKPEVRQLGV